jgi:hypothetical protein
MTARDKIKHIRTKCVAFFVRNYNLIFNRENCMKIKLNGDNFEYGEIILDTSGSSVKYLGANWYVVHKKYRI